MTQRMRRITLAAGLAVGLCTAGRALWSQAVMDPLDQMLLKESVCMTVGAGIEKCERVSSKPSCAELEVMAQKVRFPISQHFPPEGASWTMVQMLDSCKNFDELACAVMAWNDQRKAYPAEELLAIASRCGRCKPETVEHLRGQYCR